MDVRAAIAARQMTRSFEERPLPVGLVDELLDVARRAPSAGNTQAVSFVVLEGPATQRYWDVTLPPADRDAFAWPGLLRAPALVVVVVDPDAYVQRYAEPDKVSSGLGRDVAAWPVPYWFVDAGCVVQNLLLLAVDEGLGALLFGAFEHEGALRATLGVAAARRIAGVVALGYASAEQRRSRSASRARPSLDAVIHRPR